MKDKNLINRDNIYLLLILYISLLIGFYFGENLNLGLNQIGIMETFL